MSLLSTLVWIAVGVLVVVAFWVAVELGMRRDGRRKSQAGRDEAGPTDRAG